MSIDNQGYYDKERKKKKKKKEKKKKEKKKLTDRAARSFFSQESKKRCGAAPRKVATGLRNGCRTGSRWISGSRVLEDEKWWMRRNGWRDSKRGSVNGG